MTLEDFFTLSEMKDGLTACARVEELVSVMKKGKDSLIKNVSDATRQWAAVASTIAATEIKECLDLFVQLDGLWFIDRWLKDAQIFSMEESDSSLEEAISALLEAVEKLHINNEKLISSGICTTVKSLLSYKSSRVQDRARALFDNWKAKDVDIISLSVEKAASYGNPTLNNEHAESQSATDDLFPMRSLDDLKLECTEGKTIKISNGEGSSKKISDHAESKGGCSDTTASHVNLKCVEGVTSLREEVGPSDRNLDLQCPSDPQQVSIKASLDVLKPEHVAEDASHDNKVEIGPDRLGEVEVSSAFDGIVVSSKSDVKGAKKASSKPDPDTNEPNDESSVKSASSNDTNQLVGESRNGMEDIGGQEQNCSDQGEGCPSLEETKGQVMTTSELEDVGRYDEVKRRHKGNRKYFGNTCEFSRLTESSKNTGIVKHTDMDLEDGTVDALDFARLVAKEVEREVVGYDEQSGSSSDERISRGSIGQPDSPESINGGEDPQTDAPTDELPTMENLSDEASKNEHLINSAHHDAELEKHMQDMDSSQVTNALLEPEVNPEKNICEFDLNQDFSSEELDHQVDNSSNPVSVVSATRPFMAPGMPAGPIQFEGNFGWKGSAATSAFRPASPRRTSDSGKALSGAGTSSCSRQRQDFLDIDLNVAEDLDGKTINPMSGKQNAMLPGLPSAESSVEPSPKISERLKFDLNQIGEGGDLPVSEWNMDRRILGHQNSRRSPSPASSSSCMQSSVRNFDLNDNPSSNHSNLLYKPSFLGEPPSGKASSYVGPPDDSVISILGTKVKKNTFPQSLLPFPNGRALEPSMDGSLLRGRALVGLGAAVPHAQSFYSYNGLAMAPVLPFPSGATYVPAGPIPCMFDSRGAPVMPQIIGSASMVPSSYGQSSLVMNMMGSAPGSNSAGPLRPNLDLNSGYAVEGGNRDPTFFRQFFVSGQGRPLEEQLNDNFRPLNSGAIGGKRKEPDSGWELNPTNYKHHQPPYL